VSLRFFRRHALLKSIIYQLTFLRVQEKVKEIVRYLPERGKILDIGSGNCVVCQILRHKQFQVIPLDIRESSFVDGIVPILYNGERMPFKDKSFDVAMLLTVLHHTRYPERVLEEAKRVARSLIIIEEIYTTRIQRLLTFLIDSLFNLEFLGHPHTNRTDEEWKQTFYRLGFEVKDMRYGRSLIVLKRAAYFLNC